MKPKSLLMFAVAAGCGLVAMLGAQQVMSRNNGPKIENVKVLVAREEIESGVRLTADAVVFRDYPKDTVPEGAVTKEEDYVERALKHRAYPGQPILIPQLGEKGQFGSSLQIPKGMRLATLKVDPTMIHSGIMKPGDRVDVVLTYKVMKRNAPPDTNHTMGQETGETETIAKDVKGVSLLVSPVQAEFLKYAESKGDLHLTLRGTLDVAPVLSPGADADQLERLQAELSMEMNPEIVAESTPPPAKEAPKDPSFAEFVKDAGEALAIAPAEKPVWKVQVFQGADQKTFEFEVEEPKNVDASLPASSHEKPAASLWSPFQQWFFSGSKSRKTAFVTP
jgi:pilus assembly protein CpaB